MSEEYTRSPLRVKLKPASAVMPVGAPTEQKQYSSPYEKDFTKAASDFWKDNKKAEEFKTGYNIGKFGNKEITLDSFLRRLPLISKEIMATELTNKGISFSDFYNHMEIMEKITKILSQDITAKQTKENNLEALNLLTMLHGMICGWMDGITDKIESMSQKK